MIQRHRLTAGFIALCIAGSFGTAKADDTASVKKTIQAIYAKVAAAAAKKDAKGMMIHLAPDYEETTLEGTVVKMPAIKTNMQNVMEKVKSLNISVVISKLTLKGDKATVINKDTVNMVATNPQTKKEMKIVLEETNEAQWEKRGGAWLVKSSKTLSMKQVVDGKEIPTPKKQPKKG
ncbi:MAG: hypothetical protein NT023_09795 [Armatimonadetes bacterium]|nr:hypothetical protein [Armatimonadota bacterium]